MSARVLNAFASIDTDGWWTICIPELTSPGPAGRPIVATGSATTWRGVAKSARELAAAWLDVELAEVDVNVKVVVADEITRMWVEGGDAEAEGRAILDRAAALRLDAGYPVEAVAETLGVTRQRVQQLDAREKVA